MSKQSGTAAAGENSNRQHHDRKGAGKKEDSRRDVDSKKDVSRRANKSDQTYAKNQEGKHGDKHLRRGNFRTRDQGRTRTTTDNPAKARHQRTRYEYIGDNEEHDDRVKYKDDKDGVNPDVGDEQLGGDQTEVEWEALAKSVRDDDYQVYGWNINKKERALSDEQFIERLNENRLLLSVEVDFWQKKYKLDHSEVQKGSDVILEGGINLEQEGLSKKEIKEVKSRLHTLKYLPLPELLDYVRLCTFD